MDIESETIIKEFSLDVHICIDFHQTEVVWLSLEVSTHHPSFTEQILGIRSDDLTTNWARFVFRFDGEGKVSSCLEKRMDFSDNGE